MNYLIEYLTPDGVTERVKLRASSYTSAYLNAMYILPLHTIILTITEV